MDTNTVRRARRAGGGWRERAGDSNHGAVGLRARGWRHLRLGHDHRRRLADGQRRLQAVRPGRSVTCTTPIATLVYGHRDRWQRAGRATWTADAGRDVQLGRHLRRRPEQQPLRSRIAAARRCFVTSWINTGRAYGLTATARGARAAARERHPAAGHRQRIDDPPHRRRRHRASRRSPERSPLTWCARASRRTRRPAGPTANASVNDTAVGIVDGAGDQRSARSSRRRRRRATDPPDRRRSPTSRWARPWSSPSRRAIGPNTAVNVGIVKLVLNEQIPFSTPDEGLTVNAVHVTVGVARRRDGERRRRVV